MEMEMERRKRSCFRDEDAEEEEEEEEEKMEKFFSLIRSFKDACDRRRNELNESSKKKKKKKIMKVDEDKPIWLPSFKLEDFAEEAKFSSPPLIFSRACNSKREQKEEQEEEGSLDLKLTLYIKSDRDSMEAPKRILEPVQARQMINSLKTVSIHSVLATPTLQHQLYSQPFEDNQIHRTLEVPQLIVDLVPRLGLKVEEHVGNSDKILHAWESASN
ncbi:hypothetical protein HHK36_026269 [Tetracentron sinense]|uniref:Uncharacterized protein n=1 Tax=Tetracentron sinense TaxID=13715 RepID=A0A835D2G6_TETSI|nr:hypothetical protein HHK36_026269 [Tetracentron sinense]